MIRSREEKELRVLGIVRRIRRVKKMGKGRGKVRKRRIDRKRRVDFGEAGAYRCDSGLIQRATEIKERG